MGPPNRHTLNHPPLGRSSGRSTGTKPAGGLLLEAALTAAGRRKNVWCSVNQWFTRELGWPLHNARSTGSARLRRRRQRRRPPRSQPHRLAPGRSRAA